MPTTKTSTKGSYFKGGRVPLERALSKLGILSRSQARKSILAGEVRVDGKKVLDPHTLVTPEAIRIEILGKEKTVSEPKLYVFYKTKGTVCTRSDERGRRTVFESFSNLDGHYHTVGRLDVHTTGLLLITNHSRWSDALTDPKNQIPRVYHVTVEKEVTQEALDSLKDGIDVAGVFYQILEASIRKSSRKETHLFVTLAEGKNREVRRIFEVLGHPVRALKRLSFGPFALGNLKPGAFRDVTAQERSFLHTLVPSSRKP